MPAISNLEQALRHLEMAGKDDDGFIDNAIELIEEAIKEINEALPRLLIVNQYLNDRAAVIKEFDVS